MSKAKAQTLRSKGPQIEKKGYFREVIAELRKVTWPTMKELRRMTGVVIATVFIFATIIGLVDALLGVVINPLYSQK